MNRKKISGERKNNRNTQPSSPGRRSFVKGVATLGAGLAASPLLSNIAEAQAPSAFRAASRAPAQLGSSGVEAAKQALVPFEGSKVDWHGYDRYDFVIDGQTLAITPFQAPASEKFNVGSPQKGQRRCIVVVPKAAAAGNPWSWRGCYWNHQPQTEVELLRRGFHIAYISADATLRPDNEWDAWYAYLTGQHGLSSKPAFIGMSRGGEFSYTWATGHPDKVTCIYADNPGMNPAAFAGLGDLARNDVPLLQVCGSIDPIFGMNASAIEAIYRELGDESR